MNFTVRTFKAWQTRDVALSWVNNYELSFDGSSEGLADSGAVEAIVAAERAIHLPYVQFLQATVSTWVPDGKPYDPTTFVTVPLEGEGARLRPGEEPMADTITFYMRRTVRTGRTGKMFYRGVLTEDDCTALRSGKWELTPGRLSSDGTQMAGFYLNIAPLFSGSGPGGARIMMFSVNSDNVFFGRNVENMLPAGVKPNQRDHAYFDRGAASAARARSFALSL